MKKRFEDIVLDGVLPVGTRLVVDTQLLNVILIKGNILLEQIHLGNKEYITLLALCGTFPRGCPYQRLLAVLKNKSEEEAEMLLKGAVQRGDKQGFEYLMRPIRTFISRVRTDVAALGIDIAHDKEGLYGITKPRERDYLFDRIKASLDANGGEASAGEEVTALSSL